MVIVNGLFHNKAVKPKLGRKAKETESEIWEQVRKSLRDTFGMLTKSEKKVITHNGVTLERRLFDDKWQFSRDPDCGIAFGSSYTTARVREYKQEEMYHPSLEPLDDNMAIDPELYKAIDLSRE